MVSFGAAKWAQVRAQPQSEIFPSQHSQVTLFSAFGFPEAAARLEGLRKQVGRVAGCFIG